MSVYIDGYLLDAALSETHTMSATVTKYPTESGSKLSDNISSDPRQVTIVGIVSDTPIGIVAAVRASASASVTGGLDFLPTDEAFAMLERLHESREPVPIDTTLRRYESMALTDLVILCDETTGHALNFTASFVQIRIINNNRTIVRADVPIRRNLGNGVIEHTTYNTILDEKGQPVTGVHFDPATQRFVDSKGVQIFDKNTTDPTKPYYFDSSSDRWIDKNTAHPVTQAPAGAPGVGGTPWWWNNH